MDTVHGLEVRELIRDDEVLVSWEEFVELAIALALQLSVYTTKYGPFDYIVAIKHGATTLSALLERVLEHERIGYARFKRLEEGLTLADSPPPKIVSFPSTEDFRDQRVLVLDEVWESGKTMIRAIHQIEESEPRLVVMAVLHFKADCNIFPQQKPDCCGRVIDRRYRLYPWELFERIVRTLQKRIPEPQAAAVAE